MTTLALLPPATAQTSSDMQEVLKRLDRLEAQNRALISKVDALQAELAAARGAPAPPPPSPDSPTPEERLAVQEARSAEQ
ncbi:MAG: hypothetical protein LAQ30_16730, partial [Acidobacteriia bacterium]|nr:hypothetical protein [Terriglobia bacterium]